MKCRSISLFFYRYPKVRSFCRSFNGTFRSWEASLKNKRKFAYVQCERSGKVAMETDCIVLSFVLFSEITTQTVSFGREVYRSPKFSLVKLCSVKLPRVVNFIFVSLIDKSAIDTNRFKAQHFPFEYIAVDDLHYYRRRKPCNCNKSVVSFLMFFA